MVMNVVAICLVATSLAAAGVWSPPPATEKQNNVIVKDGHRVVVVEYDQDGRANTKVSISPEHEHLVSSSAVKDAVDSSKEKVEETVKQDGYAAKELICDAFGKCKHVISSALGRGKEEVSGKFEEARESVEDVKESAYQKGHDVKERVKEKFEDAKEKAEEAKESVSRKAHEAKETAKKATEEAKTRATEATRRASEAAESAGEHVAEKAREAKETTKDRVKASTHWIKEMGKKIIASQMTVNSIPVMLNLLGFVTAYGMCMWVTFISSYVLARALPRQQFAMVQSKIYPVYFRAMAYSIGTALLGHLLSQRKRLFENRAEMWQVHNLLASLLMVIFNMLYLEPRATKVMFERIKLEKEEGRGRDLFGGGDLSRTVDARPVTGATTAPTAASTESTVPVASPEAASPTPENRELEVLKARVAKLNDRLKSLNSYSSFLNILTLMGLTWHLVYLSQRLSTTEC